MNGNITIDEEDIKQLFEERRKGTHHIGKKIVSGVSWLSLVLLFFVLGFVLVNWPATTMQVRYLWQVAILKQNWGQEQSSLVAQAENDSSQAEIESLNNRIIIPKIKVSAPIIWNIEQNNSDEQLKNGVVHFEDSSLPGTLGGNIFIAGRSSNFWWSKDDYNQVFTLLSKLEIGDKIVIVYNQTKYIYEVNTKKTVSPTNVELSSVNNQESILTLMTSVPIGTSWQRLLVSAKQIWPVIAPQEKSTTQKEETTQEEQTPPSNDQFLPIVH